jgi:hypothetical protein
MIRPILGRSRMLLLLCEILGEFEESCDRSVRLVSTALIVEWIEAL